MKSAYVPIPKESRLTKTHRLNWFDSFNLRDFYPIRDRYILQHVSPYAVTCIGLLLASGYVYLTGAGSSPSLLIILVALTFTSLGVLVGATIFWIWYRSKIEITIEGLRFNSTRGIIRKHTGSSVIRAHNMFYVYQRAFDLPFGLWNFQMYGSNQTSTEYAHVPGLSKEDAFDMFRFFTNEVSQQVTAAEPHFGAIE